VTLDSIDIALFPFQNNERRLNGLCDVQRLCDTARFQYGNPVCLRRFSDLTDDDLATIASPGNA
jgi:hypothetical protein